MTATVENVTAGILRVVLANNESFGGLMVYFWYGDLTLEQIANDLAGTGEVMSSVSHCFGTT